MNPTPSHHPSIAGIILSGGASTRMGNPKALLPFRNKTFLSTIITSLRAIECQPIMVVAGEHYDLIKTSLESGEVEVIENPEPENGPLSSLQIALKRIKHDPVPFIFWPVDHPAVEVRTLRNMFAAWRGVPAGIIRPVFNGRGGHPVLLGAGWIDEILALPFSRSVRDLLRDHPDAVINLPVPDPGVILNIDTPEDYQALLHREGDQG